MWEENLVSILGFSFCTGNQLLAEKTHREIQAVDVSHLLLHAEPGEISGFLEGNLCGT